MASSEQHTAADQGTRHLIVSVGTESFEPGQTQVLLDPTGLVQVSNRLEGRDERRAQASVDRDRASQMIRGVSDAVRRAKAGKRYGLPDEPRYRFEVGAGEERGQVEVWRSELPDHPELQRLVTTLQRLIDDEIRQEIIL